MIYLNDPQIMAMLWGNADEPLELKENMGKLVSDIPKPGKQIDAWSSCHRQNGPSVEWTLQAEGKKVPCRPLVHLEVCAFRQTTGFFLVGNL